MVETCRWPKASYSVLSIWLGVDAQPAGRVAVDQHVGFQSLLLLVGVHVAQHRVVLQRGGQLRRPFIQLGGCCRPAACTDRPRCSAGRRCACPGTGHEVTARAPGTTASLRRRPAMTVSMSGALRQRLQRDEDRSGVGLAGAAAAALAGEADHVLRPPGRCCTMSAIWVSFSCIAWNEMLWSACMPPINRPVSCCGKKPFGMIDVQARRSARW